MIPNHKRNWNLNIVKDAMINVKFALGKIITNAIPASKDLINLFLLA